MHSSTPAEAIQLAADITKACAAAGIKDAAEIPAMLDFAASAKDFSSALLANQVAQRAYDRFITNYGTDDPGQDYYVAELTRAKEVYGLALRRFSVALEHWNNARGLGAQLAA